MSTILQFLRSAPAKRFAGCMALALILALMIGPQEGLQSDYFYAIKQAWSSPRLFIFLGIGVLIFVGMTFWPYITPYLVRPGVRPLSIGAITVAVSFTLMHWSDDPNINGGKFSTLATKAANTKGLAPSAKLFFTMSIPWLLLIVAFGCALAGIIVPLRPLAWAAAVISVVSGVWAYLAHALVVDFIGTPDHSLGAGVALIGFLTMASASIVAAVSKEAVANSRAFVDRVFGWRPGMPLVVLALIMGVVAFTKATWFSPQNLNATLADTKNLFQGKGLANLAFQYLAWLGWVLFGVTLVVAAAAAFYRRALLGWIAAALGAISVILTLSTMYDFSQLAAAQSFDGATGPWQNLGTGGWLTCAAFFLLGGAGMLVVLLHRRASGTADVERLGRSSDTLARASRAPGTGNMYALIVIAVALFYPPTATGFWQKVLVSEIGIYVLLAVGLNVVVGWAGLLDLGYIAFYAIGSYTTAYLVGALPVKPPSWLHMTPLLAIPFAIGMCLIAGVALGAPTLRLRGDYLAIVTLGFGEIIRITANNNPANITNGPKGAFGIPHPRIHIGPLHITWGQNNLQYWYLLLFLIVVVVLAFRRLEESRLGRAWAAIREDEIAASATGINTTRVKLLAFAIGASTSGLAGVFFASQIGYINPDNFILNNSILVVAFVVFGGMGSLPGAMAGAAVLTWLPEFLKDQVPAEDRQMWIGAVLVVMMIFRPSGLIPARRRAAELRGFEQLPSAEATAVPISEGLGAAVS